MSTNNKIIIISESGWQGARELSLEIAKLNLKVIVLIKGRITRDEREMIGQHENIKNVFMFRKIFPVSLFVRIFCYFIFFKRIFIFITKDKTEKWMLKFYAIFRHTKIARLRELDGHFAIFDQNMKSMDYRVFLEVL